MKLFKQPSDGLESYNFLDYEQTNIVIGKMIQSQKPFMVSRFGFSELVAILHILHSKNETSQQKNLELLHNNAGFFPADKDLYKKYVKLHIKEIIPEIDLLGSWIQGEHLMKKYFSKSLKVSKLFSLAPFFSENPWSQYLKDKNVVVINPFSDSINQQFFTNRKFLFQNPLILPNFNLKTVKAVQSIAYNIPVKYKDKTWFDALEDMRQETLSLNPDIVIIGCGAYGMALAGLLKKDGKQTIHLGGKTQLLFGIRGKRWDNATYEPLINEYWIRPNKNEQPENFLSIEGGCYW